MARPHALERICMVTAIAALALIAVKVVHRWGVWVVWDDAWMFQRYAHNILGGHGIAWNAGEGPTYGVTSLLYLAPSIAARALFQNVAAATIVASAATGIIMLCAVGFMISGADGRRESRWLALTLFAASFAASKGPELFTSGMDTFLGAGYLALFLGAAHRSARAGRRRAAALGVFGGIALWIRPELALFSVAVAIAALLWPGRAGRRPGFVLAAMTVATFAALLGAAYVHFGTPLPLSSYAKTSGVYGAAFLHHYRGETVNALGQFIAPLWPLLVPIAFDVGIAPRRYFARARPTERAALAATVGFVGFHLFVAVPIMGMAGRLYEPAIVALAYLATQSLARLHARIRGALGDQGKLGWAGAVVLGAVVVVLPMFSQLSEELTGLGNWLRARRHHDIYSFAKGGPSGYWGKIEQLRNLDDSVVIATTEVGFLGIYQPDKRIIDMAGLNDRRYAFGFDPALLVDSDAPDLIYMPHPHYVDMVAALEAYPAFAEEYLVFTPGRIGSRDFGVAIRRDSPAFETMHLIFSGMRIRRR